MRSMTVLVMLRNNGGGVIIGEKSEIMSLAFQKKKSEERERCLLFLPVTYLEKILSFLLIGKPYGTHFVCFSLSI
jgi:hypothetical protein